LDSRSIQKNKEKRNKRKNTYLLDDPALAVACSEVVGVDDALDVVMHVADELEPDVSVEEGPVDLVEALVQDLLVYDRRVAHLPYRAGYGPA